MNDNLIELKGGADGTEIIAYTTKDGRMFWHGQEIKNEPEFKGLVYSITDTQSDAADRSEK